MKKYIVELRKSELFDREEIKPFADETALKKALEKANVENGDVYPSVRVSYDTLKDAKDVFDFKKRHISYMFGHNLVWSLLVEELLLCEYVYDKEREDWILSEILEDAVPDINYGKQVLYK